MRTIKIGKSSDNDFVINAPDVSRSHAVIVTDGSTYATLRDLGSTNGTYVNGKRISECKITVSDRLNFGNYQTTLAEILNQAGKTKVKPSQATPVPAGSSRLTIGRLPDCDIVLHYDDVSRHHAILYKAPDGSIYIEDNNSENGTYVNGVKVTSERLNPNDTVSITRNHNLDWSKYFTAAPQPELPPVPTSKSKNTKLVPILAAAAIALVAIVGVFLWQRQKPWDKEKIYDTYNSAVCWVCVDYGYKIYVDGEDITSSLCSFLSMEPAETVHIGEDGLESGNILAEGTGFFIDNDGHIATNLHIVRPWLFDDDADNLETDVNRLISLMAAQNPFLSRAKVEVKGVMDAIYVVPNGLPITMGNAIKCSEYNAYDDINKDVALLQTESRSLPQSVKNIIDIYKADLSDNALKEGKTVFTIGFPFGLSAAINDNEEIRNQVHDGSVTQNRGDYEFGHDAETASGASGSPIFNDKGQLVGIHHAGVAIKQGFNQGIKAKYIVDLLKK